MASTSAAESIAPAFVAISIIASTPRGAIRAATSSSVSEPPSPSSDELLLSSSPLPFPPTPTLLKALYFSFCSSVSASKAASVPKVKAFTAAWVSVVRLL